ncbi:MAG: glutamine--fructose-6-phosphate transaminase (isomerizing) [Clostridiales bacterium]|nr:glutamine--fructose-6-phosphate transaminase (isomerizing) [Clostridiales bacterium]
MCGIVGYIGNQEAQAILLDGLSRLEYRGYDSAGIAVMHDGRISLSKAKGRLKNLMDRVADAPLTGSVGIGHTRWATHGEPSDINAHPHTDMKSGIAIVHNGIIENHDALRSMLQAKGCVFVSQTDTEVIAHLLSVLDEGDMLKTLYKAQAMLEGSYALGVLSIHEPDTLYCMRKDSPLVVGLGKGECLIASDIPALIAHTREVELLDDKEIAVLKRDSAVVYDPYGNQRPLKPLHVDWDVEAAEKGGYAHFMLKEIHEEPGALKKTFTAHVDTEKMQLRADVFPISAEEARSLTGLTIVACGTAYHAGVVGKYVIEKLARIPVTVDVASEFRYRSPIMGPGDLFMAISQSGETADTLAAMREAGRLGAKVMALTNVVGSSIAREAGKHVMYTYAGPEIAVASTKAYITQVEVMLLIAVDLAVKRGQMTDAQAHAFLAEMAEIPAKAEQLMACEPHVQRFASKYYDRKHVFYIGRGIDNALAMEASLKLKEVSYIMSEAYAAGELKHGTIALIEEGTLVCALLTQEQLADKTLSNVREVRSRGAKTMIVCPDSLAERAKREADEMWVFPDCRSELTPLLAIIPVQILAYYMAVSRGCDVDKPRNLAKSVTVE